MSKKSKFIRIELNESDFQYKFILDNLWFYFLFLCLLIVLIYYFHEFSLGVICFSFLSGVFAFFSAFKAKFGKFECENFLRCCSLFLHSDRQFMSVSFQG